MPLFSPGAPPGRWPPLAAGCLAALLLALSGCSPTFNWRELRPQGTPLLALMPCKPEHATRAVPLAGTQVELHMHSCDAGGLSFAVAWAELGDAARVDAALLEWPRASVASLRLDPGQADAPESRWSASLQGAPRALGVAVQGSDPRGQAMRMRASYFARGSQVFQAAVFGADLPAEVTATFFEALRLP